MGNGIPGDGNDNWKTQLRGNDGRWINMYGSVSFDYTPSGGGPTKKGRGTFQGVSSPGRAKIFVKDDPELEVGLYEVQSQYVRGVKAFIPTAANKPESTPAVEEPSTPELKDEITGDEAMQVVRNAGAQYAKSQGRFAMSRTYDDVRQGLRAQYMQFLDGIKKDNPELLKNQFIINEDGTGRTGDIETEDDFWGAITAMQVSTTSRWVSPDNINPLAKEVNRRYAEKFLGVKKDGLISFYRNVIQEKEDPADAAAGYATLDRKMAWDYNPDARPGDVVRGRYIVKAKPDEVLGILGYSGALDEFGVVISPEVTSLPGRFERVGDLEKQRIDGAPWVDYEELDKQSRFGGNSPFRFLAPMTNFDYYALDSSPFGEGDGWASFYEANGLQQGAMPNKYNELYGEGAWEKDWGSNSPTARRFASLFIKFTDKDGKEKWGLDAPKLRELSNIDMLNNAEAGDDFDRNIKVLSSMQELMGKPFFVNKGHDQSDSRIPKPADAEGSAPIARIPEIEPAVVEVNEKEGPDVENTVEAPKGREVSSRTMQKEFSTAGDSSELKNRVAQRLLERILAKGITKDELVEMLDSLDLAKSTMLVGPYAPNPKVPTWDNVTGIVKWEGSKRLTEVRVSAIRTEKYGFNETKTVTSGNLGLALNNAIRIYKINKKQDGIDSFNEYMTYDEAIESIRKINKIINERFKDDAKYQAKSEIVFEDNIEEAKDIMSYSAVSNMVKEWAGSSNDDSVFSLALQDTVAKLFNLENYLPWTTREDTSKNKDALIELHGKVISAYAEAQYEITQEELKAKQITSVELHRGMRDPNLRATLDEYGSLPDNLVILRPLSSFSYDLRIARGFTGENPNEIGLTYDQLEQNPEALLDFIDDADYAVPDTNLVLKPNEYLDIYGEVKQFGGVVLNTTVPADRIFSMPFSGVGCLSEAEVVVLGPNLRAEILTPQEAEDIATYYEVAGDEED
jgi:hypothetical protein